MLLYQCKYITILLIIYLYYNYNITCNPLLYERLWSLFKTMDDQATVEFFTNQLSLADAPVSLIELLYTQADLSPTTPREDFEARRNDVGDVSMISTDEVNEEQIHAEQAFFMNAVNAQVLKQLLQVLESWQQDGSDDFWRTLNVVVRSTSPATPGANIRRKSHRRSSIGLSLKSSDVDVPLKCLVSILHRCVSDSMQAGRGLLTGILASECYLLLVKLPGSGAYFHVFASMIMHDILAFIRHIPSSFSTVQTTQDKTADKMDEDFDDGEEDIPEFERLELQPLPEPIKNDPKECFTELIELLGRLHGALQSCKWIIENKEIVGQALSVAVEMSQVSGIDTKNEYGYFHSRFV